MLKGASVFIRWTNPCNAIDLTEPTECVYVSFGNYDETTEQDGFNTNDQDIFFYTTPAELQAKQFQDFEILEVVYHDLLLDSQCQLTTHFKTYQEKTCV